MSALGDIDNKGLLDPPPSTLRSPALPVTQGEFRLVCRTVGAFAHTGPWAALRALVRFFFAPLALVARYLPDNGIVVDIGCGQGHFLKYCSLLGYHSLVGLDPSLRGLRRARSTLARAVILVQARAEDLPVQACQGIVALDVLYLLDREKQESFLARAAAVLPSQGLLLIKTMAPERCIQQWINRLQEHIAVKMLRITMGSTFCFRTQEDWVSLCERMGFHAEVIPLWKGYLHPHVLVVARRTTEQV